MRAGSSETTSSPQLGPYRKTTNKHEVAGFYDGISHFCSNLSPNLYNISIRRTFQALSDHSIHKSVAEQVKYRTKVVNEMRPAAVVLRDVSHDRHALVSHIEWDRAELLHDRLEPVGKKYMEWLGYFVIAYKPPSRFGSMGAYCLPHVRYCVHSRIPRR